MTVCQLISELQWLPDHAEIRLAEQPAWPFEYDLSGVSGVISTPDADVVYLIEGGQLGYLPEEAREELGWES